MIVNPGIRRSSYQRAGIPLANRVAHFDAGVGVTSAGGFASVWTDASGNGRSLLQATGANQPHHLPSGVNLTGTCQAGSGATTLVLPTTAIAVDDIYNGMVVTITAGTCSGQSKVITDYVGATKTATVSAWTGTPDNTSVVSIAASQPSLFFDGAAHYMKCTAFTLNQPETVYLVVNQVSWTNDKYIFDGNASGSMTLYQAISSPLVRMYAGGAFVTGIGPTVGATSVLCGVYNGASSFFQINSGTAVTGTPGSANAGGFVLGASTTPANYSNIQTYEALVYNVAHDAAARSNVIAALQAKWGVA